MKGEFSTARQGLLEITLKECISKALEESFFWGLIIGQITPSAIKKVNQAASMATPHAVERVSQPIQKASHAAITAAIIAVGRASQNSEQSSSNFSNSCKAPPSQQEG